MNRDDPEKAIPTAWFRDAFDDEYRSLYAHRDEAEARRCMDLLCVDCAEFHDSQGRGARLLDLCCGAGRHSAEAARRGFDVVGFDLSSDLLSRAVEDVDAARFARGDMRRLPFADASFDVMLNVFTSFGYFLKDDEHRDVASEMARVLKPGGRLLWDHINPAWLRGNIADDTDRMTESGVRVRESRRIDETDRRVNKTIRLTRPDGSGREYVESVRFFEPDEARRLFEDAGFEIIARFGDYDRDADFSNESPRQILLMKRR